MSHIVWHPVSPTISQGCESNTSCQKDKQSCRSSVSHDGCAHIYIVMLVMQYYAGVKDFKVWTFGRLAIPWTSSGSSQDYVHLMAKNQRIPQNWYLASMAQIQMEHPGSVIILSGPCQQSYCLMGHGIWREFLPLTISYMRHIWTLNLTTNLFTRLIVLLVEVQPKCDHMPRTTHKRYPSYSPSIGIQLSTLFIILADNLSRFTANDVMKKTKTICMTIGIELLSV